MLQNQMHQPRALLLGDGRLLLQKASDMLGRIYNSIPQLQTPALQVTSQMLKRSGRQIQQVSRRRRNQLALHIPEKGPLRALARELCDAWKDELLKAM